MVSKKEHIEIADVLHQQHRVSNAIGRQTVERVALSLADWFTAQPNGKTFDYDAFMERVTDGPENTRRRAVIAFEVQIDDRDMDVVHDDLMDAVERIVPLVADHGMRPLAASA